MIAIMRSLIVAGAASMGSAAAAATLLTSSIGYSGPMLDLSAYRSNPMFTQLATPISLPGGLTTASDSIDSVIGRDAASGYAFAGNGQTFSTLLLGTNSETAIISISFAAPVTSFGAPMNYAPIDGIAPIIRAYDGANALLGSFDLSQLAPINTPGGLDVFSFRGIAGDGALIARFELQGAYLAVAGVDAVPEPQSWLMMVLGFGIVGAVARRRAGVRLVRA